MKLNDRIVYFSGKKIEFIKFYYDELCRYMLVAQAVLLE